MARELFGTDGVRGVAGERLTADLALALGRAAAQETGLERPRVLLIRDTRESGEMLEAALAAGVTAFLQPGGSVRDAEVIAACDAKGAAMVFTGVRHFRH